MIFNRAKLYGWHDTYSFTKAMGEMVIDSMRENIPIVIIRPSIITSSYEQPFPGWIQGLRYLILVSFGFQISRVKYFITFLSSCFLSLG